MGPDDVGVWIVLDSAFCSSSCLSSPLLSTSPAIIILVNIIIRKATARQSGWHEGSFHKIFIIRIRCMIGILLLRLQVHDDRTLGLRRLRSFSSWAKMNLKSRSSLQRLRFQTSDKIPVLVEAFQFPSGSLYVGPLPLSACPGIVGSPHQVGSDTRQVPNVQRLDPHWICPL